MSQPKRKETAGANLPFIYREYSPEQLKDALRKMHLIRQFEEGAEESYMRGLIHG
ncbi:MAG: pyruvate dehydrogenase (acetyl-transferring) E1 component subunit alpha, partial [Proteobacteria bacterium]|nr:pyruvate dehydrogenase (acetyl-transferring) E1 component subunit alpha [Pseudomonadota bacterium]